MLGKRRLHKPAAAAMAHLDELLDEALQETFPASDPIAVAVELELSGSGASPTDEMRAAQTQMHGASTVV